MKKHHRDRSDGAVTLLGQDQLGDAVQILAIALIDLFAENEPNQICVLLDTSRLTKIAQLRPVIALPPNG